LLEERKVGARVPTDGKGRAGLLGNLWLPHAGRPMAGATLQRRLTWHLSRVLKVTLETPRAKTLSLEVPDWPRHTAGQHADVRLTAPDGYQARRSYSIASAPEDAPQVALTVERIDNGEVSPYLVDELAPGDQLELRGPIGGYFIWSVGVGGPLL